MVQGSSQRSSLHALGWNILYMAAVQLLPHGGVLFVERRLDHSVGALLPAFLSSVLSHLELVWGEKSPAQLAFWGPIARLDPIPI